MQFVPGFVAIYSRLISKRSIVIKTKGEIQLAPTVCSSKSKWTLLVNTSDIFGITLKNGSIHVFFRRLKQVFILGQNLRVSPPQGEVKK